MTNKVITKIPRTPAVRSTVQTGRGRNKTNETGLSIDVSGLSEEVKIIVTMLSDKLDRIIERLDERDEKINELEIENATLRRDLTRLEERLDDIENNERKCDVILSGDAVPVASAGENTQTIGVELFKRRINYNLPMDSILTAYRVGSKPATQAPDRRNILMKLKSHEVKSDIMQACRTSKPSGLFVKENLTASRSKILFSLRQLRKKCPDRIDYCGSRDGRVFIWTKPADGRGNNKKIFINSLAILRKLCNDEFGVDYAELMGRNEHQL